MCINPNFFLKFYITALSRKFLKFKVPVQAKIPILLYDFKLDIGAIDQRHLHYFDIIQSHQSWQWPINLQQHTVQSIPIALFIISF